MQKKVGVVLVNYKTYVNRFLDECRDSLRIQDYPKELVNVYVVDNASSQESIDYIKNSYPEAIIVPRPDGNYSAANNAGIRAAVADGCEYFVIANMDVKYHGSWLSALVKGFESSPDVGIAQSKVLLYPQNEEEWKAPKINTLGNIMHFLGFGFTSAYKENDREIAGYPEITGYASGCSFITSKEVIEKIGMYDEEYYMYHDDVEMSWRVRLAGYKLILVPDSIIYHKYEFGRSVMMIYYMERNRYLAMLHYYHPITLILIAPAALVMECGMIAYAVLNKWWDAKFKAIKYFWKLDSWKKIYHKRKQVAKFRKLRDRDLIKSFEGRVLFQEIANPILNYLVNPMMNIYWKIIRSIIVW